MNGVPTSTRQIAARYAAHLAKDLRSSVNVILQEGTDALEVKAAEIFLAILVEIDAAPAAERDELARLRIATGAIDFAIATRASAGPNSNEENVVQAEWLAARACTSALTMVCGRRA